MYEPKIEDDNGIMISFAEAARRTGINISTIFIWHRDNRAKTLEDIRYCNSEEGRLAARQENQKYRSPIVNIVFNRLKTCFGAGGKGCIHYGRLTDAAFNKQLPTTCSKVDNNKCPNYEPK